MLKKLFLPLFTISIFFTSLLIVDNSFAYYATDCSKIQSSDSDRQACEKNNKNQEEKARKDATGVDCSNSTGYGYEQCRAHQDQLISAKIDSIKKQCENQYKSLKNAGQDTEYYKQYNKCLDNNGVNHTTEKLKTVEPSNSGNGNGGGGTVPGSGNVPTPSGDGEYTVDDKGTVVQPTSNEYKSGYELPKNGGTTFAVDDDCNSRTILGMVPWDCHVDLTPEGEDQITGMVVMIASNIFKDITVIASFLVIGFIIYGGYLYIFANGDVGKVTTGKKALNQAFIGLAITLLASVIVSAIRIALMHGQGDFSSCATQECVSADTLVGNLIQWVVGICGVVAAIFVVGGGIMYITSAGDPNKLQTAKNIIKYALIGLVIVALAEIITGFMTNVIIDAKNGAETSYINNIKEYHENQKIA